MKFLPLLIMLALQISYASAQGSPREGSRPTPNTKSWTFPNENTPWEFFSGSKSYKSLYSRAERSLGLEVLDFPGGDGHGVRFLIISSFDTTLSITLTRTEFFDQSWSETYDAILSEFGRVPESVQQKLDQTFTKKRHYDLSVAYKDFSNEHNKFPDGNHRTEVIERFYVTISPTQFDYVIDELFKSGFFSAPNYNPTKTMCADGIGYFVEATVGDHQNFAGREDCGPNFKEDMAYTGPLFSLTKEMIPQLANKIDGLYADVTANGGN